MSQICVSGSLVRLRPIIAGRQLAISTSRIPGITQSRFQVKGKNVLTPADIRLWANKYVSPYTGLPPYCTPMTGVVKGGPVTIRRVSRLTHIGSRDVILQSTKIRMRGLVVMGSLKPPPPPPAAPEQEKIRSFLIEVSFISPNERQIDSK